MSQHFINSKGIKTLISIATVSFSYQAFSQVAQLEEVIVTAQKRTQSLQDVPVAVSVMDATRLERTGAVDILDLQANVPSMSLETNQSSSFAQFEIRGIASSTQNLGLEPAVGLYVNDVYRARPSSMIDNMVDMERVEVLRGPQGTLFGRNTTAGAISFTSKAPDFEGSGFLSATAGSNELVRASGAKSFTVIDDVLAVRTTGFLTKRDGYTDLVNKGQVSENAVGNRDRWGLMAQALYNFSDTISFHVIADYSEIDEICCGPLNLQNNLVDNSGENFGTDSKIKELGGTVISEDNFYDRQSALSVPPLAQTQDGGISVKMEWDADDFLFTGITAYREHESLDRVEGYFTDLELYIRANDVEQSQFSQEFRISGASDNLNYLGGLYYFEQELLNNRDNIVGKDLAAFSSVPAHFFVAGAGAYDRNSQDNKSYAAYGQLEYNLNEDLVLSGGLRLTYEDKTLSNTYTQDAPETRDFSKPNVGFYFVTPLAPTPDVSKSFTDTQLTGGSKLSWFANDDIMIYGSFATGYKAGGLNADRVSASTKLDFDAEDSISYELGMKAEFPEQALRANIALFRTDIENLQVNSFTEGGFSLTNAGKVETYGAELDLFWQASNDLQVTFSASYVNATFEDYERGACESADWKAGTPDPRQNEDGSCNRSGERLSIPPFNAVLTANKTFELSEGVEGFVYGELVHASRHHNELPVMVQDAYQKLNLRAGISFIDSGIDLLLWGRNVTDKDTFTVPITPFGQEGRVSAYAAEPRSYGLTVKKEF